MANIFHIDRPTNKITLGTDATTIVVTPLTASLSLALDASKNLVSVDLSAIYQPLDAVLTDLAALDVVADNEFIVGTGAGVYAHESGVTVRTSIGLGETNNPIFNSLKLESRLYIKEQANAAGSFAGYAQIWSKSDTPNTLWFANDAGTSVRIAPQDLQTTASPLFAGVTINSGATPTESQFEITANGLGNIALLNYAADNCGIFFDAHYDSGMKSTDAGSNFGIRKLTDKLKIVYDSAVAVGEVITWNDGLVITTDGFVGIGGVPVTKFTVEGTITLKEQASANADIAAYGQDWVKTAAPCQRWWTDDTGIDYQLSGIATGVLNHSFTWDAPEIADGDEAATSVTVTGAAFGDFVLVSFSANVFDLVLTGEVTSENIVTCVLANNTGAARDLASGTCYIRVLKK